METIGFRGGKEKSFSMGGNFFFSNNFGKIEETYSDELVFVDVSKHVQNDSLVVSQFFPVTLDDQIRTGDKVVFGAGYGYPHDRQKFDFDETGEFNFRLEHIGTVTRELLVRYYGEGLDQTISKWKPDFQFEYPLKGMSGGPMFAVVDGEAGFSGKFAGIITMAGEQMVNAIKIDTVIRYLNKIIEA